jgi:hypothetical protein
MMNDNKLPAFGELDLYGSIRMGARHAGAFAASAQLVQLQSNFVNKNRTIRDRKTLSNLSYYLQLQLPVKSRSATHKISIYRFGFAGLLVRLLNILISLRLYNQYFFEKESFF